MIVLFSRHRSIANPGSSAVSAPTSERNITVLGMSDESSMTVLESTTGASRFASIVMSSFETPSTVVSG